MSNKKNVEIPKFPWEPIDDLIVVLLPEFDERIPKLEESKIIGLSQEALADKKQKHWEQYGDMVKYRPVVAHGPKVREGIKVGVEILLAPNRLEYHDVFFHEEKGYAVFADTKSNYFGIKESE